MSLTLILIRHAKSDWKATDIGDFDRPLNPRGRRDAPRIGHWLAGHGYLPETVLCSAARRTQETWAGIADMLPEAPTPQLSRALYHADPATILTAIQGAEGRRVAVVGHNPGIGSLARSLAAQAPEHPKFGLYPTGATLVLEFEAGDWADAAPGRGRLVDFVVPRELPDP